MTSSNILIVQHLETANNTNKVNLLFGFLQHSIKIVQSFPVQRILLTYIFRFINLLIYLIYSLLNTK